MKGKNEGGPAATHAFARRGRAALLLLAAAALAFVYLRGVPENPPGFFVDEASIAYNAQALARTGADEHGKRWPLYFRAFGEYKSPVYVYLLACVFKLAGPSITAARLLSALAGFAAAALLGLVAWRATRHRAAGFIVAVSASLTPWLFEISRLVFEVALMPLALAVFLLVLRESSEKEDWTWGRAAALGASLGLVSYTYSGGRLLAPLYAAGLLLFVTRSRMRGVLRAWAAYAATLLPLLLFAARHPGALGERFKYVTFVTPQSTYAEIVLQFFKNYAGSFSPWAWLVEGDPEPRHHVAGMGSLLAATFVLAFAGLVVVLLRHRRDGWWRFVLYGLAVSPLPAALTLDRFHTLRLVALPVFLLLLNAPALARLNARDTNGTPRRRTSATLRRASLVLLVALTLWQGAAFLRRFERAAPERLHNFDAFYPEVFDAALRLPQRPIHVVDAPGAPGYVLAYWYATLRGVPTTQFLRLENGATPPPGALVISTETPCADCQLVLHRGPFRAYVKK
ncbi:MAG TPA: glycosyltransferase family 39 protein [Pyrinomonadaceae bacterium]|nr:glycosyltransferase family 39 protein [Pyrinomonadaceae bacterium]